MSIDEHEEQTEAGEDQTEELTNLLRTLDDLIQDYRAVNIEFIEGWGNYLFEETKDAVFSVKRLWFEVAFGVFKAAESVYLSKNKPAKEEDLLTKIPYFDPRTDLREDLGFDDNDYDELVNELPVQHMILPSQNKKVDKEYKELKTLYDVVEYIKSGCHLK